MMKCFNEEKMFEYLKNPAHVLEQYYNQFIEDKINTFQKDFICESRACINEFMTIMKPMASKLIGTQLQWQVDLIFQQNFVKQKQKNQLGVHLRQLFLDLLMNGQVISTSYQQNIYNLKQGVSFQILKSLENVINAEFLNKIPEFQIFNFTYFILNLEKSLSLLDKQITEITKFQEAQYKAFRQKCKLILCKAACPCCDRLCDADMRTDPHHSVHRINSGHQMRAVKGMVVQKKVNSKMEFLASVLRCQDVEPDTCFEYYGKQYIWKNFVQQKSNQWNFKSKNVSKILFQHIWDVCGKKICDYHTSNGKIMSYIGYSDGSIQFIQGKQQDFEFIFAIDGSGSMSGNPWETQLKQLKNVLNDISKDQSNTVSVLVFDTQCHPFCINQNPTKIDIQQIPFPCGGTAPDPTFLKAADIINKLIKKQPKSVYFFYISDGGAQHPSAGIKQLLKSSKEISEKKLNFVYSSILIGSCSHGKSCMEAINKQMGGSSQYVSNAGGISQKIKEILAQ